MYEWKPINQGRPNPTDWVLFYAPQAKYIYAAGKDFDSMREEFPDLTHYKVVTESPK